MPLILNSSYPKPPFWVNRHIQTIMPSFFRKEKEIDYERTLFHTPDHDEIFLDWSKVGSDKLLILDHGLCGHTHRHYMLSTVHAFNALGWDCLAWNYRTLGKAPSKQCIFTTFDSSNEVAWITQHALDMGHYKKIAHVGFSIGGNLLLLYLGREARQVPSEMIASVSLCATLDIASVKNCFATFTGQFYEKYFLKKLLQPLSHINGNFPYSIDLSDLKSIATIRDFDRVFTCPIMGYKDPETYWETASSYQWLNKIQVPSLIINPLNDPFTSDKCYPYEAAQQNPNLTLEVPSDGGHCGFITPKEEEWWPLRRFKEFILQYA